MCDLSVRICHQGVGSWKKDEFHPPQKKETPTELQSADDLEKQKRTQLALALGSE